MSRHARYTLLLLVLVMVFSTVDRQIVSILLEDIKTDLALDDRMLGWILGPSFTLVYALSAFPLARWADTGIRRNIIALGIGLWSLFTVATAFVQSFVQLFLMRMGVGIGEASAGPTAQSIISDILRPEQRSRGMSIFLIGAVAGLAVGMVGGGWVNEIWGWRFAFVAAGVPGLVIAALFRWTVGEPTRGAIEGRSAAEESSGHWLDDCRHLLSLPSLRWIIVASVLGLFYAIGKNAWEPTFIRRIYQLGSGATGTWYFVTTPLPATFGLLLGGWWCDRWSRRDGRAYLWVPAIGQLAAIPLLVAFFLWPADQFIPLPFDLPAMPVAFVFSIFGSVLSSIYSPALLTAVQNLARLKMRATAAAVVSTISTLIGSSLGPLVVGDLNVRLEPALGADAVRWALTAITAALVFSSLACLLASRTFVRDLPVPAPDGVAHT
jgi:MFS family permease